MYAYFIHSTEERTGSEIFIRAHQVLHKSRGVLRGVGVLGGKTNEQAHYLTNFSKMSACYTTYCVQSKNNCRANFGRVCCRSVRKDRRKGRII